MPNNPAELTALLSAVGVILTALSGLIAAVFVQARKAKADSEKTRAETEAILADIHTAQQETLGQVTNTHKTNLRDDLDKVKDIAGDVAKLGPQMHEITEQIRAIAGRTASIEGQVQSMSDVQSSQGHQLGEIRRDLSDERAERRQDSDRIQAIDENARNEHQRMWRAIGRKRTN